MDETMLTKRQRRLLTAALHSIEREPRSYNQNVYGIGPVSCRSPACIAGHIVASNLRTRTMLQIRAMYRRAGLSERARLVEQSAMDALELTERPTLFSSVWPKEWFEEVTVLTTMAPSDYSHRPSSTEAIKILHAILDGRITNALVESA